MKVKHPEKYHQLAVKICKAKTKTELSKLVREIEKDLGRPIEVNLQGKAKIELEKQKEFLLFDVIYRELADIYKKKTLTKKKQGRPGSKVKHAFSTLTDKLVPLADHAKKYGVSIHVLEQAKRFDVDNSGTVHTKKIGDIKMIWREEDC